MTTSVLARDHLTEQEEAFVWEFASSGSLSDAWRKAFPDRSHHPATLYPKASRLVREDKIRARLDAVRAEIEELHQVSRAEVVVRSRRIADKSEAAGEFFPAIKAVETLARIGGHLVDKRHVLHETLESGQPGDLSRLTDVEAHIYRRLSTIVQGGDPGPAQYEYVPIDTVIPGEG